MTDAADLAVHQFGHTCGLEDALNGKPDLSAEPADLDAEVFSVWWRGYALGYKMGESFGH